MRLKFGNKLFLSHFLAVFLVSGSVGTFFYRQATESLMRSLRSRLQNSAALLSVSIPAAEMDEIRGPADVQKPVYLANLSKLRHLRQTNPDIAFLYVMRLEGEQVLFVIDSDETDAQAVPGHVYDSVAPNMRQGFHSAAVDDKITRDEWGSFLSGYAPLHDGEGRYLVGIDMRADEVGNKLAQLRLTGLVSLLASLLLALVFALYFSRSLVTRIDVLTRQCHEIARGRLDQRIALRTHDEFDDLVSAFNTMGEDLGTARRENEQVLNELRAARDHLSASVDERTRDLQATRERLQMLRGLLPICSSCKKIRDDKGYWQQVEQFVETYTEARFTHGVCPDCLAAYLHSIEHELSTDQASDASRGPSAPPAAPSATSAASQP